MVRQVDAKPRTPLNRERVVQKAIGLADKGGLGSLTMRGLAHKLGVVPMALYKHVANKDELFDLMADVVFAELEVSRDSDWKSAMRNRGKSMREVLLRHPWAVGVMEPRNAGPASRKHHEATMACLRDDAGLPFRAAVHAYSVMDSYIYGFALQEKTLPFKTPEESGKLATERLKALAQEHPSPADEYPYLVEIAAELAASGYDYGEEFEFGLDLILDGIERLRADTI